MKKCLFTLLILFVFLLPTLQAEASSFRTVKQTTTTIELRDYPAATGKVLTAIPAKAFVTAFSQASGWASIQYGEQRGYVEASKLSKPVSTTKIASSKSGLVVKATPTMATTTLATLQYNMIVEDFGAIGGGWSFVQYGNVTGYVHTNFIGVAQTMERSTKEQVTVRNIASKSGAVVATVAKNATVHVHSTIAGWAYISTANVRGYVEAAKLKNPFLIVIDPGHQLKGMSAHEPVGPGATVTKPKVSSGTTGTTTRIPEYKMTLQAGLILRDLLQAEGYEVHMTRTTHNVSISNKERAQFANALGADLVIRLHGDGSTNPNQRGLSVLVPGKNQYSASIYTKSEQAGKAILSAVKPHVTVLGNGLFYRNDLSGFNWSTVPSVLLELGFMSNPTEDRLLADPAYLQKLMGYVRSGVNLYFAK